MEKESLFLQLIQQSLSTQSPFDISYVKELCSQGFSDHPPIDRALAWMILLGIYPQMASQWNEASEKMKNEYTMFIHQYQVEDWLSKIFPKNSHREDFEVQHPNIMHIIHGDITRSGRHFYFLPPDEIPTGADPANTQSPFLYHIRRLERILYVFSQTNPEFSYMQGFNEIILPIYFVLVQVKEFFHNDYMLIEAITFSMFQSLLNNTGLQELFKNADKSDVIIKKLDVFEKMLKNVLPDIYEIFSKLKISPLIYAYRWFNLLFSQEYELPVLLMIWDALFAHLDCLIEYCFYLGIAHIQELSPKFDPNSFPITVKILQNTNISNPIPILKNAKSLWINRCNFTNEEHSWFSFFK